LAESITSSLVFKKPSHSFQLNLIFCHPLLRLLQVDHPLSFLLLFSVPSSDSKYFATLLTLLKLPLAF
jgi:hypothetical protein